MSSKPSPYQVIVDTRERCPYVIDGAVRGTLRSGDYSLAGMDHVVAVERKELGDFLGCVGNSRERFDREMDRLAEMRFAAMVIEGNLDTALGRCGTVSGLHANAVIGSIVSWMIKRHVVPVFCSNRLIGQQVTEKILEKAWEHLAPPGLWIPETW